MLDSAKIREIVVSMRNETIDNYVLVIPPSNWASFVRITRRGQWSDAYREWRRLGKPGLDDARSIFARYGKTIDDIVAPLSGELGSYRNVRFIESSVLPVT